jgi:glycosyltransferase involved in cell wall biosynthesis
MKLSIGICTHNEGKSIALLLQQLVFASTKTDMDIEIVVVDDYSTDPLTIKTFTQFKDHIKFSTHALNGDFSAHKNYLNSQCTGDWILNLDGDESFFLPFAFLHELIDTNPHIELVYLPRINTVDGLTVDHIKKWGWTIAKLPSYTESSLTSVLTPADIEVIQTYNLQIDEHNYHLPIVCWPDYQGRLYKNAPHLQWKGTVHERLDGATGKSVTLPPMEEYAIGHYKNIVKQEQQNNFYTTL